MQLADCILSKPCQDEHAARRLESDLETRLPQIDSTLAFAPTAEGVAGLPGRFSHKTVQAASHKADVLAQEVHKRCGQSSWPSAGLP